MVRATSDDLIPRDAGREPLRGGHDRPCRRQEGSVSARRSCWCRHTSGGGLEDAKEHGGNGKGDAHIGRIQVLAAQHYVASYETPCMCPINVAYGGQCISGCVSAPRRPRDFKPISSHSATKPNDESCIFRSHVLTVGVWHPTPLAAPRCADTRASARRTTLSLARHIAQPLPALPPELCRRRCCCQSILFRLRCRRAEAARSPRSCPILSTAC